jgi:hypothetical protein
VRDTVRIRQRSHSRPGERQDVLYPKRRVLCSTPPRRHGVVLASSEDLGWLPGRQLTEARSCGPENGRHGVCVFLQRLSDVGANESEVSKRNLRKGERDAGILRNCEGQIVES